MENTYIIPSNGALNYDNRIGIGAGNFWREEYIDEQGIKQQGVTAGLWLWLLKGPEGTLHVRVHVGSEFKFDKYTIKVVEINKNDLGFYVRLAISIEENPS